MENTFNGVTTQVINLNCPYKKAWTLLSDPLFQKKWGTSFFKDISNGETGFIAETRFGKMSMKVVSDEALGVIDTYMDGVLTNPTRLMRLGDDACIYTFTLFKPAIATEEMFQTQGVTNLIKDLKALKQILESPND